MRAKGLEPPRLAAKDLNPVLEHAEAVDAEEDERFGDARGDELPEPLSTREGRQRWLRDARRRLDERRAREARPRPGPRPKRLRRPSAALMKTTRSAWTPTPPMRNTAGTGG